METSTRSKQDVLFSRLVLSCTGTGEELPLDMHFITVLLCHIFIHTNQPQSDGSSLQMTCTKVVEFFFNTLALLVATSDTTE